MTLHASSALRLSRAPSAGPRPSEVERARALLAQRAVRGAAFEPARDLFHDPAWEILLALFIAEAEDVSLSLDDVSDAVALSPEATRRWLLALEQTGMIADLPVHAPYDSRTTGLTAQASAMMQRFLAET